MHANMESIGQLNLTSKLAECAFISTGKIVCTIKNAKQM
jgi:hypothetical protein